MQNHITLKNALLPSALIDAQLATLDEEKVGSGLANESRHVAALLDDIQAEHDKTMQHIAQFANAEGAKMQAGALQINLRSRLDKATSSVLHGLAERIAQLSARLVPEPAAAPDKLALVLEYRARLRERDPTDVIGIYLEASRTRDQTTIAACESCPLWDRLIDADVVSKGRQIQAQVQHPDIVASLKATQVIEASLQQAINRTMAYCQIRIDEVATLADGETRYY